MKPQPYIIERTYDASASNVWKAITEKEFINQWFMEVSGFEPKVGYAFTFEGNNKGTIYYHQSVVKEVVPEKRLSFSWRYKGFEGDSLVTIELFPEGKKTKVKLTHEGLETFPVTVNNQFAFENFNQGWTHLIGVSLKKTAEGLPQP